MTVVAACPAAVPKASITIAIGVILVLATAALAPRANLEQYPPYPKYSKDERTYNIHIIHVHRVLVCAPPASASGKVGVRGVGRL
jgi:hypothetical protein